MADIDSGNTALGIELGSTRIKACLNGSDHTVLAAGVSAWENRLADGLWTYSLDDVWVGLQECVADLLSDTEHRHGVRPQRFGAIGISAMMHGYLAFGSGDELLVPFRTWRNTNTGQAAAELSDVFGLNIPLRWSVAHLYQAILDGEEHVRAITSLNTLAGYVHWQLTGRRVLGIGDASGMFPIDAQTNDFDDAMLARFDDLPAVRRSGLRLRELLPDVLVAGQPAGTLTEAGCALIDPAGRLGAATPLCPPEGDAGTGMVATNSVSPRTGNVSAGTSIFAMVTLERPLARIHAEIDVVNTPTGNPVAMVHCNNGASELGAWAEVFGQFAALLGTSVESDTIFATLLDAALQGEADGGGLLAYNYQSGEPVTGLTEGRPMVLRTPDSRLTLANFVRVQIYSVFATLALGMHILAEEGVAVDVMFAHGGLFRTAGATQRILAAAVGAPVAVGQAAGEGGAWGIAVLAAYLPNAVRQSLPEYLQENVFAGAHPQTADPDSYDVAGFAAYLERFSAGLAIEQAAVQGLR